MRITDVVIEYFCREWEGRSTAAPRFARGAARQYVALLSIETDASVTGECLVTDGQPSRLKQIGAELEAFLVHELRGRRASDREWLWSQLGPYTQYLQVSRATWAAVDIALWDLAGKQAGLPVYELLGAARDSLPAYISSPFHEDADGYVSEALAWAERGVRAYKPHYGGRPPHEVKAHTSALRAAVGEDHTLMLDASLFYDLPEALEIGRHIEQLDFAWFEDPLKWGHSSQLVALADKLDIPLAYTDHPPATYRDVAELLGASAAVQVLRIGSKELGITALKRASVLAEAFGRRCEMHVMPSTHGNLANLHVALSSPTTRWVELVAPFEWVQWGTTSIVEPDADGIVHAPTGPGLGVELDREQLDRSRLETRRHSLD